MDRICLNTIQCKKGSLYTMKKIPFTNKILCGTAQGDILIWKVEMRTSIRLQN